MASVDDTPNTELLSLLGTAVTGYEESRQLLVDFLTVSLKANLNESMQTSVTFQG